MKFKSNSIYAINKKTPNRIIFESAMEHEEHFIELKDGVVSEHYINHKDGQATYSIVSPTITAATFILLKAQHDEELRLWDNKESADGKMTCSIHLLEDTTLVSVASPQDILNEQQEQEEIRLKQAKRKEQGIAIFSKLTEVQKRRYKMHMVDKLSTREIAKIEGVDNKTVWLSIEGARKKIKKFKNKL